jgi:aryl-alcohol dehydrogenase-like predicted oxidoreductase
MTIVQSLGRAAAQAGVCDALHPSKDAPPAARLILGGRFGEQPAALSRELCDRFREAGGRLVETAHAYANGAGERAVADLLSSGSSDMVCITKVGLEPRPRVVREEIKRSAERLRVDALDVVLLHRDDQTRSPAELLEPLFDAVESGMARLIGVANWGTSRLAAAAEAAYPVGGLSAASAQFSLAVPARPLWEGTCHADPEMLEVHARLGLPLIAWSANARGWFAGNAVAGPFDSDVGSSFSTPANEAARERCRTAGSRHAASPSAVALAWTLQEVPFALPVIGPASRRELEDAIAAASLKLSAEERRCLSGTSTVDPP